MSNKQRKKNKLKHTITIREERNKDSGEFELTTGHAHLDQCPKTFSITEGQSLVLALNRMIKSEEGLRAISEFYAKSLQESAKNRDNDRAELTAEKVNLH